MYKFEIEPRKITDGTYFKQFIKMLIDAYHVSWGDLCAIKRSLPSVLVTCLAGPTMYLVGFGYGLGGGMKMEGFDYIAFLIPGIISMTTLSACFTFTSTKIFAQKTFHRSIDEMMLCPISVTSIVLGKSMMGVVRGLISCTVLMIAASLISKDFHLSAWLVMCVVICCFVNSFLGVAAGMIMKNHSDISLFSALIITPMTFLCGTIFSFANFPVAAQAFIGVLPLSHCTQAIRALALQTVFPWVSLIVLLIYGAVFFIIPYIIIKRGAYQQ